MFYTFVKAILNPSKHNHPNIHYICIRISLYIHICLSPSYFDAQIIAYFRRFTGLNFAGRFCQTVERNKCKFSIGCADCKSVSLVNLLFHFNGFPPGLHCMFLSLALVRGSIFMCFYFFGTSWTLVFSCNSGWHLHALL